MAINLEIVRGAARHGGRGSRTSSAWREAFWAATAAVLPAAVMVAAAATHADAAWPGYGGNAQHTALGSVPTQALTRIAWQTPVDLNPQYSGSTLLIHYGSPLVTEGNTVVFPVKTGVADTFRVEARRAADGALLWQLNSDYRLPPHGWIPSFGITLTPQGRMYMPAAGGTLLWTQARSEERRVGKECRL